MPARDAGVCWASEFSPLCVATKLCPPTHGRAAKANAPALHHAEVPSFGPEGATTAPGVPAGPLQLVRSRSLRAGPVAVARMPHQRPLLRDALRSPSTYVSTRLAAHAARRLRPPRAARKAWVVRASVPCSLRPSRHSSRRNQIKSEP